MFIYLFMVYILNRGIVMDFFSLDFNKIFLKKHGKEIYDAIIEEIKKENLNANFDNDNIEIIFKVALLDFFELKDEVIEDIIKDVVPNKIIDVKKIKAINKSSILKIKKYLNKSIEQLK